MKTITVTGAEDLQKIHISESFQTKVSITGPDSMDASDGYHTFSELYDHRITLFIALCQSLTVIDSLFKKTDPENYALFNGLTPWRTKYHSDGEKAFGGDWFVLGIGKDKGTQMTYHLPLERWDDCDFAETLEKAPEYDGHTPADVLERLKKAI